jgi:hypothetical protein
LLVEALLFLSSHLFRSGVFSFAMEVVVVSLVIVLFVPRVDLLISFLYSVLSVSPKSEVKVS